MPDTTQVQNNEVKDEKVRHVAGEDAIPQNANPQNNGQPENFSSELSRFGKALKNQFKNINWTKVGNWFKSTKGVFVAIAGIITFAVSMYNQFKSPSTTTVAGYVYTNEQDKIPVDATIKIISPIQGQTETDRNGRFKFKFQDIQSDTFLFLIQGKKMSLETKENKYVDASERKNDFVFVFNANIKDGKVYVPLGKTNFSRKPNFSKIIKDLGLPTRR